MTRGDVQFVVIAQGVRGGELYDLGRLLTELSTEGKGDITIDIPNGADTSHLT